MTSLRGKDVCLGLNDCPNTTVNNGRDPKSPISMTSAWLREDRIIVSTLRHYTSLNLGVITMIKARDPDV